MISRHGSTSVERINPRTILCAGLRFVHDFKAYARKQITYEQMLLNTKLAMNHVKLVCPRSRVEADLAEGCLTVFMPDGVEQTFAFAGNDYFDVKHGTIYHDELNHETG